MMRSTAGPIEWAHKECEEIFEGIAEIVVSLKIKFVSHHRIHGILQHMDSPDRPDFIAGFQPGGKYAGITGLLHMHDSARYIGNFDKEIIAGFAGSVQWIAHTGAGYDQVDVAACKARGIFVSNTPGAVDNGSATTALYLLISALRHFSNAERSLRAGQWKTNHKAALAHDLEGHTLAILGMGGVGLRLAQYVHAFPMRVIYHNRRKVEHAPEWCEYYPAERFDEFLAAADVFSVHVPLRADTVGLVDEKMIRKLKKGVVIVNTARGKVIDEEALIRALEDGHVGSVGLDVYINEPEVDPRLLALPNATLLPHMGTETIDSRKSMEVRAMTNLRDFFVTGKGTDLVAEYK